MDPQVTIVTWAWAFLMAEKLGGEPASGRYIQAYLDSEHGLHQWLGMGGYRPRIPGTRMQVKRITSANVDFLVSGEQMTLPKRVAARMMRAIMRSDDTWPFDD